VKFTSPNRGSEALRVFSLIRPEFTFSVSRFTRQWFRAFRNSWATLI
jgi:hypothetical protein